MLIKKHRLPSNINFKNCQVFSSNAFSIKITESLNEFSRFGIVVSKKIDKRAVGRNKIKRQIRNNIDKLLPEINMSKDVLIIARAGIKDRSSDEIFAILKESFEKFKLLK